jgi:hypothetical protein
VHTNDSVWTEHPGADILGLYRGGRQALELLESGIYRIKDIPKTVALKGKQLIQHQAHASGQTHVDRSKIAAFLDELEYPLYFLDFETFGTAVPLVDGARPYQQIPFQFSVHVVEAPGDKPRHHSHLSLDSVDPRPGLLASLQVALDTDGNVVAYNQAFEKRVLTELAGWLPEHSDWVTKTNARFVDLLAPFRDFAYYNPQQDGSASLKEVLPAITGRGYEGFEIANGGQASIAYLYATFGMPDGKRASSQETEEIRKALEVYCGRDTEGMVWIVEKLAQLAKGSSSPKGSLIKPARSGGVDRKPARSPTETRTPGSSS